MNFVHVEINKMSKRDKAANDNQAPRYKGDLVAAAENWNDKKQRRNNRRQEREAKRNRV